MDCLFLFRAHAVATTAAIRTTIANAKEVAFLVTFRRPTKAAAVGERPVIKMT